MNGEVTGEVTTLCASVQCRGAQTLIKYLLAKAASCKEFGLLLIDIRVASTIPPSSRIIF